MVADDDVHAAARRGRLRLQAHQQVHDLARIVAAIEEVAQADEVCRARLPVQVPVDHTLRLEQGGQFGVRAVNVGEGDDALDVLPLDLLRRERPAGAR